jgi:hypothetical protein
LDRIKDAAGRAIKKYMADDNPFKIMAEAGSKGSTANIAQTSGILGQQFVNGLRMPETLSGGKRATPYFDEGSLDPEARGFIINSFLSGLTPAQLFFHQAGSRVGLMDTALKTADTGHMHHRIVKALEDVKVLRDGSVRSASGAIFQATYGDDGFDAASLEIVGTPSGMITTFIDLGRTSAVLNAKYGYVTQPLPVGQPPASVRFEPRQVYVVNGKEAMVIRVLPQVTTNKILVRYVDTGDTESVWASDQGPRAKFIEDREVYLVRGRQAEITNVEDKKTDERVEVKYRDTDQTIVVWPTELGDRVTTPSSFVNIYRVESETIGVFKEAIVIGQQIVSVTIQFRDDKSTSVIRMSTPLFKGNEITVGPNKRRAVVLDVEYNMTIQYLDSGKVDHKSSADIGAAVRRGLVTV